MLLKRRVETKWVDKRRDALMDATGLCLIQETSVQLSGSRRRQTTTIYSPATGNDHELEFPVRSCLDFVNVPLAVDLDERW